MLLPGVWQDVPDPNAAYREDYARYTDISAIEDLADRATQFMDFQAEGFDSQLEEYVQEGIFEALIGLYEGGQADALYPRIDRWLETTDDDRAIALGFQAAAQAGDHPNIVKYGSVFYEANPSGEIAQVLATSHKELGNTEEYVRQVDDAINALGIAANFSFAYDMFANELEDGNWQGAADWAERIRTEVTSAPEGISASDWQEIQIEFQSTVARAAFEAGRHREAVTEYTKLADMDRDRRAMANLQIGRSYLELQEFATALDHFANAYVLGDATYSGPARAMVEEIYTTNTGGSLEGLEESVLRPARRRMGV
jgi:tetratricopeptide (TPR) repeat protein